MGDQEGILAKSVASKDPTPSQFAMARERWVRMLRSLPERHRQVIRMRLMGRSTGAIATTLGVSERTVQRVIDRITEAADDGQFDEP